MSLFSWISNLFSSSNSSQIPVVPSTSIVSWEIGHPERAGWTDIIAMSITTQSYRDDIESAEDWETIRPGFYQLTIAQRELVIAQLFCAIALYESSWDPTCADVDVGTESDKNTWSIGLLQMSVCDQQNYNLPLNYSYDDLITPGPNLILGLAVMAKQVQRTGKLILNKGKGVYWSSFSPDYGDESHVNEIIGMVRALNFS